MESGTDLNMEPGNRQEAGSRFDFLLRWLRDRLHIAIPCLLIAAFAAPLVHALLPNMADELSESYEPSKTLLFFYTHGHEAHKWGPLPDLFYGPFYASLLGYWYLKGEFFRPFSAIFTSLAHPFDQIGTLLLVARCIGLGITLIAIALYSRSMAKAVQSKLAALAATILCVATAPDLIYSAVATKPDGLMMAFLAMSVAVYALIIADGFTLRRGILLSLTAVASLSCKEQTAPAYLAIYAWILVTGLRDGRRFLADFARAGMIGVGAYLLINVVYAPASWVEHIKFWIGGPGKDPGVWAPPHYSTGAYLRDTANYFFLNLGPGGSAAVIAALIWSMFHRTRQILAAWVPLVGYVVLMILTAGYMQRYFMLPATVLAGLPVAFEIAAIQRKGRPGTQRIATAVVIVMVAMNLWSANMSWAQLRELSPWMIESYASTHILHGESIHLANPWKERAGVTRLAYLGYRVDERPLGELMKHPPDLPDFILVSRDWENWLRDFKNRPARNENYKSTGYSYDAFDGMESLGYHLEDTVRPQMPFLFDPRWMPWPPYRVSDKYDLLVYRRVVPATQTGR
jgi:hypothetical protein